LSPKGENAQALTIFIIIIFLDNHLVRTQVQPGIIAFGDTVGKAFLILRVVPDTCAVGTRLFCVDCSAAATSVTLKANSNKSINPIRLIIYMFF